MNSLGFASIFWSISSGDDDNHREGRKAVIKPKSRITPVVAEKLMELSVEKQPEAINIIESFRLEEEEAISHVEAMKVEVPLPPPEEWEKVRERYESLQKRL